MGGIASLVPAAGTALAVADLERLVVDLAARRELWGEHVRHAPDQRLYTQLYREAHLDIWLICWDAHQETGLHDHDRSSGAVRVVEGTLLEDHFTERDGSIVLQTVSHSAGATFSFDSTYIHDVRHDGGVPATSIHAYSPALWRMGYYSLGPRGLGRTSLTYLEEVEPAA